MAILRRVTAPGKQQEFLAYARALDRFLGFAEKHGVKISVQVEKEWAQACLSYKRSGCMMIGEEIN